MKMLLTISLAVLLIFSGAASAAGCPRSDANGDCKVNLEDLAIMASEWLDDESSSFITTWYTGFGDGTTVTLALAGTVDATIDWGDGTVESVTTPGPHVHDYGVDGMYTVSVTGTVTAYNSVNKGGAFSERAKLRSVDSWGQLGLASMYRAFDECSNLISVPGTSDGIEAVTDMSWMFSGASSFNQDIGGWDTSSVTNMVAMFMYADLFNGNISGWDTSSVTDMSGMFYETNSFNGNIGGWDTSSVTDMSGMFADAWAFNGNISSWDTSSVTDMSWMFYETSSFNGNIGGWDTSSVTNMIWMFASAWSFNGNISGWDTSSVTDMSWMFYGASSFSQDLSGWCVTEIPSWPNGFDELAPNWALPRPIWGTCP